MIIPCKECLVLAICRNKPVIDCVKLFQWRWGKDFDRQEMNETIPHWMWAIIVNEDHWPGVKIL